MIDGLLHLSFHSKKKKKEPRCWLAWVKSSARQALEGADLAPGTENTRRLFTDRNKRPPELLDPIAVEVANHVPPVPFALDEDRFHKNLRVAKRGAAGCPSGMSAEHLHPLMDSPHDMKLFFKLADRLAWGFRTSSSRPMGRMTALCKVGGGVCGIVAGDIVWRLVARTMTQQLGPLVEATTSPFQCALSTCWWRVRGPCTSGCLRGQPQHHHLSIDGISACDMVSHSMDCTRWLEVGVAIRAHVPRHTVVLHLGRRGRCGAHEMARRRWRAG